MRKNIIAGNWKMHHTLKETEDFFEKYSSELNQANNEIIIFPPYTSLLTSSQLSKETSIKIGAQNMHYEESGAYTGEISSDMLLNIGITHVLIGHSERRKYYNETNDSVNLKVIKALEKNMIPIVCIGENEIQREQGKTNDILKEQIFDGLKNISANFSRIIIAYEPLWAIGTGNTATAEQAEDACMNIRNYLFELFGDIASSTCILYGGSVKAANIQSLMAMENIDGVLVGGASLGEEFVQIAQYNLN